jgi:hypothetical protein
MNESEPYGHCEIDYKIIEEDNEVKIFAHPCPLGLHQQ